MQQVLHIAFDTAADTDATADADSGARLKVMKQIYAEAKLKATESKAVAKQT